ncbi:MAG: hypothetical protein SAK29_38065 [Scytonema sp. PMC 1069.18]|nr:hypothetical protein [Scytonema sp. PMC 1069.18]MEC4883756.1 hypothetical protein [Scytonema sp. PMC 1070.18]
MKFYTLFIALIVVIQPAVAQVFEWIEVPETLEYSALGNLEPWHISKQIKQRGVLVEFEVLGSQYAKSALCGGRS